MTQLRTLTPLSLVFAAACHPPAAAPLPALANRPAGTVHSRSAPAASPELDVCDGSADVASAAFAATLTHDTRLLWPSGAPVVTVDGGMRMDAPEVPVLCRVDADTVRIAYESHGYALKLNVRERELMLVTGPYVMAPNRAPSGEFGPLTPGVRPPIGSPVRAGERGLPQRSRACGNRPGSADSGEAP